MDIPNRFSRHYETFITEQVKIVFIYGAVFHPRERALKTVNIGTGDLTPMAKSVFSGAVDLM